MTSEDIKQYRKRYYTASEAQKEILVEALMSIHKEITGDYWDDKLADKLREIL